MKKFFVTLLILSFIFSVGLFAKERNMDPKVDSKIADVHQLGRAPQSSSNTGIVKEFTLDPNNDNSRYDFDVYTGNTTGFTYNAVDLATGALTPTGAIASTPFPMAEEYDGNAIYRVYDNASIVEVNPDDGTTTALGTISGVAGTPTGLAYKWDTSTMYVVILDAGNLPHFCTLDLSTFVATEIGVGTGMVIAMDFADDGYLYTPAIDDDNLYQVDPATGISTLIGPIGYDLNFGQDVTFDYITGQLYTISCGGLYALGTYDLSTGALTQIADMGGNQHATLVSTIASTDPGAPAAPTNVTAVPDAGGGLNCDIDWTCPTLTFGGDPLTELLEMNVYRDGVLIYTDSSPVIGGPGNYTDYPTAAGLYSYSVEGYNSIGEGSSVSVNVWVGEDVPDAVTDFTLTDISTGDLEALLEWVNPTAGMHGGYFSGVTGYDFERSDGFTFSIGGPVTQWIDDTITNPGIYSYTITPFNDSGSGPSTSTAQVGIGVSIVQIGNEEIGDYQIPMNLFYMDSMVEVIYLQEWIGTDMLINAVSFHANTITTIPNEYHLEIWMGVTDQTDLSAGWIDGSQLTEVFNGMHTVPAGDSWIDIPLDSPFEYEYSGNLVMMIIRDDDQYFSTTDLWWCTESSTPFRTRHAYQDLAAGQAFYAMTGPFTSVMEKTVYPDVRFAYSELGHGDVEGVITDNATSNPIEGVEVYVGNWGPATTNAQGEYLIEDLVIGIQPVTATKDGYYDFLGSVEVLPDELVTYDIGMDANLFGALDGTVTDADSGEPLVGAEISAISAGGYEYDAVTDDDGYYSIVDVVADTYDVFCSIQNYPTEVVEDVVIDDGELVTVDFALAGYAYWNDFETNDGGLISDNAAGWQWGAFTSGPMAGYSGTNGWGTVIGGAYPNSANFTLDTPAPFFMVEPNGMLEFWHWYDIENSYDGGNVKVSTDGGTNWNVVIPLTGYTGTANASNPLNGEPIFCGTSTGWEFLQFDLSGYMGQSIMFRWHFGSDSSVQYPGWYIDDVSISGGEVPDQGSLEGTVTEFGTGTPIEGAIVSVVGSGLSATTEADGTYEIQDIWPGTYDIVCVASLYLDSQELGFTISEGANTLDFSLLWSEIAVDVVELTSYLPPDDTEVQTFIITNNGPGDLEYNISIEYPEAIRVRQMLINNGLATKTTASVKAPLETRKVRSSDRDESPYVSESTTQISREMWDLQFSFDVTAASGAAGNAGCEFDGTYFYTTRWAGNLIHKFDIDGNLVEEFSIPGVTGLRDLAYDGTHFYGGAAGNVIYEMDFETQTLIGTINSSVAVRAIAYNEDLDAFFVSNFADPVGLIGHDGSTIATFNCGLASTYGFAYDNLTDGGPYLWLFDQGTGAGAPQIIHQMDALTYTMTGVTHNVSLELPDPSGIAGGLFITTDFVSGIITIGGLQQGVPDQVFCYELAPYSTWVAVTANGSGTVPGNGGSVLVEVTFDATDLAIGDVLEGELVIANNSNYTRGDDYLIPVMLIVSGNIPPVNLNVNEATGLFTWDTPPGSDSTDSGNEKQSKKELNSRSRDLLGYNVFLDDMVISIGTTTENEWLFEDLVVGQDYVAGVSAVYDDGESEVQEFEFTFQPQAAGEIVPLVTALQGNFPNPFNPVTQIAFSLNEQSHVQIMIYNIRGQLVRTLVDDQREANEYKVTWNGRDDSNKSVSSGVYFYKMKSSNYTATKKMILMK